jgi:hypothetical protein
MKKIIGSTKAWLPDHSSLSPGEVQGDKAIQQLAFCTADMKASGWTYVGEATITVDMILSPSELIASKIETLKSLQTKVRVEAQEKCNRLEDKIQNLLAITYVDDIKEST